VVAIRLPENTKATAGNGGESQNIKASDLLLSSLTDGADLCRDQLSRMKGTLDQVSLSLEDRHAAWLAGVEHGRAERFDLEVTDAVQAALHDQALEALGMAKRSARHGAAFSAMVTESGERDD
jgi:hypothetical protein